MDDKHTIEALTNEVAWLTKENERLSEDNRRLARMVMKFREKKTMRYEKTNNF